MCVLDELHVRDIALIADATIRFSPRLTVLSGETGAGKTAMLSALELIRGQRADSAVVREGSDQAAVEARLIADGTEQVLARKLTAKGRSRCSIDGSLCSVGELAQAASSLRVHGQNESSRLVDPVVQTYYLDSWISPALEHLEPYRQARAKYLTAARELEAFEKAKNTAARELEFMRYQLEQIDKVKPVLGEYEQLSEDLPRLQHAEQLAVAVESASQALNGDGCVLDMMAQALRGLERESGIDTQLDEVAERLEQLQTELSDVSRDLSAYGSTLTFDPRLLLETLERLDALHGLQQRFGPTMDDVFAAREQALAAIDAASSSPEKERELREACARAESAYRSAADELAGIRREKSLEFCSLLADSVAPLAMKGAGFVFSFEPVPIESWTDAGSERIELMYSPSAASTPRPLARIASGGELSRISLALECLHHTGKLEEDVTFVFDEIDQGVGGATGTAVAKRLSQLSQTAQVIVVTHLAQVAAKADAHYVIEKRDVEDGLPDTRVAPVEGSARVAEIARMLAGTADETALEHARSLLEDPE